MAHKSSQKQWSTKSVPVVESKDNQEETEMVTDNYYYEIFPYYLSAFFATILEGILLEFRILVECNTSLRISKIVDGDFQMLLRRKFGVVEAAFVEELADVDSTNLGCNRYKLNKLSADRDYLYDVLKSTYMGLTLNSCFSALLKAIQEKNNADMYSEFIQAEEARNKLVRRDLIKQYRQMRNYHKTVNYDAVSLIESLRNKLEDAGLFTETRSRYVGYWQNARSEQHDETIRHTEAEFSDSIEHYKLRTDHEQRVHTEIELLTNIIIQETYEKVERMMEKYEKDMEAIDLKIQITKNEYMDQREKRINMQKTMARHAKEMKEWDEFKEERAKQQKYEEDMTRCAVVVQAWWRGLLVRKQLGPYRPVKKPRPGKKPKMDKK